MDVFEKCHSAPIVSRARLLRAGDVYPYFKALGSAQGPEVWFDDRRMVMLGSSDYLGLTTHPYVKEAAAAALNVYGTSGTGSRIFNGTTDLHTRLEERLARFVGCEAATVFTSGYQVNLGVISSLLDRGDVAVIDSLSHASVIDGTRLGHGRAVKFHHNDTTHLEKQLTMLTSRRGCLVVVEGVYSMDGDTCPLPDVVRLAKKYGARLLVDDTHGIGVLGEGGRGTPEQFGVTDGVDLIVATLSKSLASTGGFVAGESVVVDYVRHNARSQVFSSAVPPASAAAVLAALDVMEREPERRERLWDNTRYLQRELALLGFNTGHSASPVIPIVVGDDLKTCQMVKRLHDYGVFVNCAVSPAVPVGSARIRISCMATHERRHLDRGLQAIEAAARDVGHPLRRDTTESCASAA